MAITVAGFVLTLAAGTAARARAAHRGAISPLHKVCAARLIMPGGDLLDAGLLASFLLICMMPN